jgi:hypothetical protein
MGGIEEGIHIYAIRKVQYKISRNKFSGTHYFLPCSKGFRKHKHHIEKHMCLDIN